MQFTKSAKINKLSSQFTVIFALFLFTAHSATSQVFPLKISDNNRYIVTKKGLPLLLNGTTFEIGMESAADITNQINRLYYAGFNALFCEFNLNNINQPGNDADNRQLKTRLRHLKFTIRAAALQNMVVFVYLPSQGTSGDSASSALQEFIFHKVRKFNNIILVRDSMPGAGNIASNPRQLQGIIRIDDSVRHIRLSNNTGINSNNPPEIKLLRNAMPYSDSATFLIRRDAYTSLLTGASGIIAETEIFNLQQKNQSFTLGFQLKVLKLALEQLPWQSFSKSRNLIPEDYGKEPIISVIASDSSMAAIYVPHFTTFSIDLSVFSSPVSLEWINPETGSKSSQIIETFNAPQLFFPPVTQTSSDWLLIVRKKGI